MYKMNKAYNKFLHVLWKIEWWSRILQSITGFKEIYAFFCPENNAVYTVPTAQFIGKLFDLLCNLCLVGLRQREFEQHKCKWSAFFHKIIASEKIKYVNKISFVSIGLEQSFVLDTLQCVSLENRTWNIQGALVCPLSIHPVFFITKKIMHI